MIDDLIAWIEADDAKGASSSAGMSRARKLPRFEGALDRALPVLRRPSSVQLIYSRNEAEADELCEHLHTASSPVRIGLDLEWKVLFRAGEAPRKTATVQLCVPGLCLVLQLSAMTRLPSRLKMLLEDGHVVKAGVGLLNDGLKLRRDYGVRCRGLIELAGIHSIIIQPTYHCIHTHI